MDLEKLVSQQNEKISQLTEMLASFLSNKDPRHLHNKKDGWGDNMPYLKEGTLFKRKNDNRWEARLMLDGKQKTVACCKRQEDAYKKLKEALRRKNKKQKNREDKGQTLFSWLDYWYKVYRLPKVGTHLSKNTVESNMYSIKKIKKVFKDISLKNLSSSYVQETLNKMTEGRSCEAVYTTLKLALEKAKEFVGINIMDFVDKVKYEKQTGRALSKEEIDKILASSRNQSERDVWSFYFYTGCRAGEIHSVKVKHVDLEKNEIFIAGTKNSTSKRTMPIFPSLRKTLERLVLSRDPEEMLINKSKAQIRKIFEYTKNSTKINFTLKDTRHTCATNCKDAGIPVEIYAPWFGWASEAMAKKVYTHRTGKDDAVAHEWAKKL